MNQFTFFTLFISVFLSTTFSQNPILKSSTTSITTLGASSSMLTETSGKIGVGTVSPTHFFHLRQVGTIGTPISPGISSIGINLEFISPVGGVSNQYLISNNGSFIIGKVGGTNTDQFKLFGNTTYIRGEIRNTGIGTPATNYISTFTEIGNKVISWSNNVTTEPNTPLNFKYDPTGTINDKIIFSLQPNGQVRIGDRNTTYENYVNGSANQNELARLTVEGAIVAQKYINTLQNWADWVFDSCTVNPTLFDEKQSIDENKTLVGVPSEKDVKSGVDMATTDAILLSKIEQNYLHDIKQEEVILLLFEKVKELELQNQELKTQLQTLEEK